MPLSLADIDEALTHCRAVPTEDRGAAWHAYVDSLLAQRVLLAGTDAQLRETRVVTFSESR